MASVCGQLKERATFLKDMWEQGKYYFIAPNTYDEKTIRKKWHADTPKYLLELKNRLQEVLEFNSKNVEKEFKMFLEENKIGIGKLLPAFRLSLTGVAIGPSLFNIVELLGKEETIARMESALSRIK